MKLYKQIDETIAYIRQLKEEKSGLGFVPTMGALHMGHLSLVERAKKENKRVAVSIFVNPIQFNNKEDLIKYPRNLEHDMDLLNEILDDDDFVFAPDPEEMYPNKVQKRYNFGKLENYMEGAHRPGHFNGVGVVINRLFNIINPSHAYFGEKDFQQLAIIRKLTEMESFQVKIVPCEILRESDGLAMSSRNVRLGKDERKNASRIYSLLKDARAKIDKGLDLGIIRESIEDELNSIPNYKVEYISFADETSLAPVSSATNLPFRCFIAVFAGEVRLIDNLPMY